MDPNVDFIKKKQGLGGAIAFEKQLGRLETLDLNSDEIFVIDGEAIPNDPSRPRVKIGPQFDKQEERFKVELDDDIRGGE